MDKIRQVLQQAPDGVEEEQVKTLLQKYDGDCLKVLTYLWEIEEDVVNEKQENKENKHDWNNIRDICNSYEEEMENFMKSKRQ
jgi:hypothetical protein